MIFVDIFYQAPDLIISGYEGDYSLENGKVCKVEKWMADIIIAKEYAKTMPTSFNGFREERGTEMCVKNFLKELGRNMRDHIS